MKTKLTAILLALLIMSAVFPFSACKNGNGGGKGEEIIDEIEDEKIPFTASDWQNLEGKWELASLIAEQQSTTSMTRLMYKKAVNQEWLDVSVDVLIGPSGSTGGIEFRTTADIDRHARTAFVLDKSAGKASVMLTSGERGITASQYLTVNANTWYNVNVKLNGSNAQYYVNGELIEERSDLTVKEGNEHIALHANGSGVKFRNFKYNTAVPKNLSWDELVDSSNLIKKGYDRYNAIKFEYPYVGMGRTSMLVGPNGFLNMRAPKPLTTSDIYRNDPMLIYDYWWDDAIKVDPFTFGGAYATATASDTGTFEDSAKTRYSQEVDVRSGKLTSDLIMKVGGEYVETKREMFVNEDGVVIMKVTSKTDKDFIFNVAPRSAIFGGRTVSALDGGFTLSVNLRKDTANNAYLSVKAVSSSSVTVNTENGTIRVGATQNPMYFYLSPASDLNEKGTAAAKAEERLLAAAQKGYDTELTAVSDFYDDIYSRSQISVPDLGVGKWYVRSLFYHVVSMAGTRVPPGCYSNNVEGFFGGPCLEFDLMFSQLAMLYVNQPQISNTTIEWIERIKGKANYLAESNYTDKSGRSISDYVPGGSIEGGYLFGWITGYDGSPTHGPEVGHEQGWVSLFSGVNYANAHVAMAEYSGEGLAEALDTLLGQARVLLAFFEFDTAKDIYVHKGVWAGGNNYARGAFSESMAAVYSIETLKKYADAYPAMFTDSEKAEISGWYNTMLPKLPPYGDKITTAYDPEKGAEILLHTTEKYDEFIVGQSGVVGGPTNMPYLWYNTIPYDHYSTKPTMLAVAESGQFDYNFNTGWSASVMGRAMEADFVSSYTRYMLRPTSLYDDFYFCENKNDSEDFERAPALGGHGSFIMALSSQLFDGDNQEYVRAFPAIDRQYQESGASFNKFLARGNIEVSGVYENAKTTLTLKNLSGAEVTRDVYIRVNEGSGAGMYKNTEYPIVDDCFIKIPGVKIAAGQTLEMEAHGIEKDVAIGEFSAQFPASNADGIRTANVAFGWEKAGNAGNYTLIISENADLSNPIHKINTGTNTFYYPLSWKERLNFKQGVTYYWTVEAANGSRTARMKDGILSFTTVSTYVEFGGMVLEKRGNVSAANGMLQIAIPGGANDTSHTALFTPSNKNFSMTVKMKYQPVADHQQAGILVYVTDNNYLKLSRAHTNGKNVFEYKSATGTQHTFVADNISGDTVYLRLEFSDTKATGYYSADGVSFTKIAEFDSAALSKEDLKAGVFGGVWSAVSGGTAVFESMTVT